MKKPTKVLLWIVAVAAFVVLGYLLLYPTYTWNQKLTLEVETPEGVKSGSSVIEARVVYQPTLGFPEGKGMSNHWRGEATIVDLGQKRFLFALLGHPVNEAQATFKNSILQDPDARYPVISYSKLVRLRQKAVVPFSHLPLLVTFTDINDPASVKRVDPYDLAAHFGAGVKLKAATLEITGEPVKMGEVEKVLGWLDSFGSNKLDGRRYESIDAKNRFANSLGVGNFRIRN
ncbi:MAG: hypothetical protein GY761_09790 [Hyphomicrobiales bacterium]|nr:hypothetical protein [Hyphomicrobiales bacterium]